MAPWERNRGGRPRHPDVLTPAEWRVLDALREGGANAEIAARLGISTNTVRYHISNMLAKIELRDRRALAAWRPEGERRRLGGLLAVPAAVWSVGRRLVWVGAGVVAVAGVVVVVVALVALEVIVEGDGNSPTTVGPPTARPTAAAAPVGETCSHSADPTCLVAVYAGAPEDYAEVADIPESALLEPDADGRYHVERGRQVTVITRAALPEGWTEFDLQLSPSETPLPASQQRLTSPPKTTYTFTVTADERGASLITYELRPARARPLRPGTAAVGDAVVATQFLVPVCALPPPRHDRRRLDAG